METVIVENWGSGDEGMSIGAAVECTSSDTQPTASNVQPPIPETDGGVFFFESEQFALKGNEDYKKLLCLLIKLEAQRSKSSEDLNLLKKEKLAALQDPQLFLERLKRNELNYPPQNQIPKIPYINWSKYRSDGEIPKQLFATAGDKELVKKIMTDVREELGEEQKTAKTKRWRTGAHRFKIHWTEEENQRLRTLYQSLPKEMLFSLRLRKLAELFETRTFKQVASRIQRLILNGQLFLNDEETAMLNSRYLPGTDVLSCQSIYGYRNSFGGTTLPSSQPASSDSDSDGTSDESELSDEEGIAPFFHITPEYKQLMHLKKISRINARMESSPLLHVSLKCDTCGTTPIRGQRWHCVECSGKEKRSYDYCELCKRCFFKSHNRRHHVVLIAVEGPS